MRPYYCKFGACAVLSFWYQQYRGDKKKIRTSFKSLAASKKVRTRRLKTTSEQE